MKKKLDLEKVKARIITEFEERPLIVIGAVTTMLYGGSALMDANTRRANARNDRKRIKIYDRETLRRERKDARKNK